MLFILIFYLIKIQGGAVAAVQRPTRRPWFKPVLNDKQMTSNAKETSYKKCPLKIVDYLELCKVNE